MLSQACVGGNDYREANGDGVHLSVASLKNTPGLFVGFGCKGQGIEGIVRENSVPQLPDSLNFEELRLVLASYHILK